MTRDDYIKTTCESAGWDIDSPEGRDVADRYDEGQRREQSAAEHSRAISLLRWFVAHYQEGFDKRVVMPIEPFKQAKAFLDSID